jgi:hypothetical protein
MWRCCKLVVAENLFPVVLMSDILNNPTWAWIFEFLTSKSGHWFFSLVSEKLNLILDATF